MYIDSKQKWSKQIEKVCLGLSRAFYSILKLHGSVSAAVLLNVYYAMVYSHMTYGVILWGGASESVRVFQAQKRILRLMYNLIPRESCREVFLKNRILTFYSAYLYKSAIYAWKNKKRWERLGSFHQYDTRHDFCYHVITTSCMNEHLPIF